MLFLNLSPVSLDCDILEYTAHTNYLGFPFSIHVQDCDMVC